MLVTEAYDSHDNSLDYTAGYEYDLIGNRLKKEVDQGSDTTIDETTSYTSSARGWKSSCARLPTATKKHLSSAAAAIVVRKKRRCTSGSRSESKSD